MAHFSDLDIYRLVLSVCVKILKKHDCELSVTIPPWWCHQSPLWYNDVRLLCLSVKMEPEFFIEDEERLEYNVGIVGDSAVH